MAIESSNLNNSEEFEINVQKYVAENQEKIDKEFYSSKFWGRLNQIIAAFSKISSGTILGVVGIDTLMHNVRESVPEPIWESLKEMASRGDMLLLVWCFWVSGGVFTRGYDLVDKAFEKRAKDMAELHDSSQKSQNP